MSDLKQLLFVDDEAAARELLDTAVADWNRDNSPKRFELTTATNVEEALALFETRIFDGALFDLRLPRTGDGRRPSAAGGNGLIAVALEQLGIPVAVMTANTNELDEAYADHELLQTFFKGTPFSDAIEWFAGLWTLMDTVAAVRTTLRKAGAETFVRRVWPQWSKLQALRLEGAGGLDLVVTRQYVTHIAELLGLDLEGNAPWHPFENYIHPALLEHRAHTGDIFELDGELWVVLTPQCDMANGKVSNVLLSHCARDALPEWDGHVAALAALAPGAELPGKAQRFFRECVTQARPARHFLPPLNGGQPLLVDFTNIATRTLVELNSTDGLQLRRGSVAPPFLPNLTQRFGAYMSRPGQPDIAYKYFSDVHAAPADVMAR